MDLVKTAFRRTPQRPQKMAGLICMRPHSAAPLKEHTQVATLAQLAAPAGRENSWHPFRRQLRSWQPHREARSSSAPFGAALRWTSQAGAHESGDSCAAGSPREATSLRWALAASRGSEAGDRAVGKQGA